jgi:hypothetical protein
VTSILIAVITVAAVALTIASARRTLAERNAVERHHRTLDVLGSLAGQAGAVSPALDQAPARDYQPRHRKARPRHRGRGAWPAGITATAVAAVTVAWLVIGGHHRTPAPPPQAQAPHATTSTAVPATGTPGPAAATALVLLSSDNQQAAYRIQRPSVDVELVPTAACWVQIRTAAGRGPVVFSGTLRPGSRRSVPTGAATGGASVQMGNPAGMSVSVDGAVLSLPRPSGAQPYTLVLQPAG